MYETCQTSFEFRRLSWPSPWTSRGNIYPVASVIFYLDFCIFHYFHRFDKFEEHEQTEGRTDGRKKTEGRNDGRKKTEGRTDGQNLTNKIKDRIPVPFLPLLGKHCERYSQNEKKKWEKNENRKRVESRLTREHEEAAGGEWEREWMLENKGVCT